MLCDPEVALELTRTVAVDLLLLPLTGVRVVDGKAGDDTVEPGIRQELPSTVTVS
jgi:hypothetical protein